MIAGKPKPKRLSEIIESLEGSPSLTIGQLVTKLGDGAFGALMFVFAVPNVIPTPPGTSAILGLPLVILTFQLMIGRRVVWLPEKLRSKTIDAGLIASFVRKAVPILKRFEKVLKPRLLFLTASAFSQRMMGVVSFLLAIILFLPIPLVNIMPAAAISFLSVGLAERDGVAVLLGYGLGIGTLVFLSLISSALFAGAIAFFHNLTGLF